MTTINLDLGGVRSANDARNRLDAGVDYPGWATTNLDEWLQLVTSADSGTVPHLSSDAPSRIEVRLANTSDASHGAVHALMTRIHQINRRSTELTGSPTLSLILE